MRIVIAAVGKLKAGAEHELFERYAKRIGGAGRGAGITGFELRELPEGRSDSRDVRMADEAGRLVARVRDAGAIILLDERGRAMTSALFATQIRTLRDEGCGGVAFLLGGPDGHGDEARNAARISISLGAMTLPHGLARVVAAEQIYRAVTIITGHPYHRD